MFFGGGVARWGSCHQARAAECCAFYHSANSLTRLIIRITDSRWMYFVQCFWRGISSDVSLLKENKNPPTALREKNPRIRPGNDVRKSDHRSVLGRPAGVGRKDRRFLVTSGRVCRIYSPPGNPDQKTGEVIDFLRKIWRLGERIGDAVCWNEELEEVTKS